MRYIWAIPLLPGLGALVNGLLGIRAFSKRTTGTVACAAMGAALVLSILAFWQLLGLPPDARNYEIVLAQWIPSIPSIGKSLESRGVLIVTCGAWPLDPLSAMMILVVTGIGTLIHIYAVAYMHDEPRGALARFFCYLNLFCFFMLVLVLGSNVLVMFVGWEGVGLCSYLLIGYWYQRKSAADAGKKAFVMNRIGDWGFILGIFLLFWTFGTLDFAAIQRAAAAMPDRGSHFRRAVGDRLAAVHRRHRQERTDSAVRLVAGRHGRSDARLGIDPRGDDGHCRRVHAGPQCGSCSRRRHWCWRLSRPWAS